MNELLSITEMYRADAVCGIAENILIENAGRAVAEEIVRRFGARRTVVVCGPGNKGKDGAVAAGYLRGWGWPVEISQDVSGAHLIIDALYGAGLNREFPEALAAKINGAGVPVVAIDLPSGLDGNSGQPRGFALYADVTITFFRKKPAHVLLPGKSYCGEIVLADTGISAAVLDVIKPRLWENSKPLLPRPAMIGHKFNRGHAVIISGGKFQTGASRLAAQACLQSGAGLVTLVGSADALAVHANHLTAVMLAEIEGPMALGNFLSDGRINSVCIGPAAGIGEATKQLVQITLMSQAHVVLDADALTSFMNNPAELFDWIKRKSSGSVVMTPHAGEFSRLFGTAVGGKIDRAKRAAEQSGAIVILKGSDTVIAHPDGRAVVNTNAPPSLATAGSGDVLAGILTGLLAQNMDPYAAACGAVWLHGDTANAFGQNHFTSEDMVQKIR